MPYAPGITYHGDQTLAAGIASLGQSFKEAMNRRKAESSEAAILRKLGGIYDPDNKDRFATLSLKELRAEAQGFALKNQLEQEQAQRVFRNAQTQNLVADNTRADAFLKLQAEAQGFAQKNQLEQNQAQRAFQNAQTQDLVADNIRADAFLKLQTDQAARGIDRDKALAGFARDYSAGPPLALRPDILKQYEGPSGAFRYALGKNPGAMTADELKVLASYAARFEDPYRQEELGIKRVNAEAAATNSQRASRDPTVLTAYQRESLDLRNKAMTQREAASKLRAATDQLKALEFEADTEETASRRAQLQERIDILSGATEKKGSEKEAAAPAAGISHEGFLKWRKGK